MTTQPAASSRSQCGRYPTTAGSASDQCWTPSYSHRHLPFPPSRSDSDARRQPNSSMNSICVSGFGNPARNNKKAHACFLMSDTRHHHLTILQNRSQPSDTAHDHWLPVERVAEHVERVFRTVAFARASAHAMTSDRRVNGQRSSRRAPFESHAPSRITSDESQPSVGTARRYDGRSARGQAGACDLDAAAGASARSTSSSTAADTTCSRASSVPSDRSSSGSSRAMNCGS